MSEKKYDFSKIEDQQEFEALPEEERQEAINEAQEEAPELDKKITGWNKLSANADRVRDGLGRRADEGIKEAVVAFNTIGLPTAASCEGHIDHGVPAPWIDVGAPNEPEERFIGEKDAFQSTAEKYGVAADDIRIAKTDEHKQALRVVMRELGERGETDEYVAWRAENDKLAEKAEKLVEEFYKGREADPVTRIRIKRFGGGEVRIYNGGEKVGRVSKLTDEQREEAGRKIFSCQQEMDAFAAFLKKKYFESAEQDADEEK